MVERTRRSKKRRAAGPEVLWKLWGSCWQPLPRRCHQRISLLTLRNPDSSCQQNHAVIFIAAGAVSMPDRPKPTTHMPPAAAARGATSGLWHASCRPA